MLHYATNINIERPVNRVLKYMTQLDNTHQLMDEVEASWIVTDGPGGSAGLGTLMTESLRKGPFRADLTWEIMAFEVDRLCTFDGDSSFVRTQVSCFLCNQGWRPGYSRGQCPTEAIIAYRPADYPILS